MELFDSHAHYNDEKFNQDREEIIKKVYQTGIKNLICAGYNIQSSKEAIKIAKNYDYIYAIIGISPNDIPQEIEETEYKQILKEQIEKIKELSKNKKVVGIRRNRLRLLLE